MSQVRKLCEVRQLFLSCISAVVNPKQSVYIIYKKKSDEGAALAKLFDSMSLGPNPQIVRTVNALNAQIQELIAKKSFSAIFHDSCLDVSWIRSLFTPNIGKSMENAYQVLQEYEHTGAKVFASVLSTELLESDDSLWMLVGNDKSDIRDAPLGEEIEFPSFCGFGPMGALKAGPEPEQIVLAETPLFTSIVTTEKAQLDKDLHNLEAFDNFCRRHPHLVFEVDSENADRDHFRWLYLRAAKLSECDAIIHVNQINMQYWDASTNGLPGHITIYEVPNVLGRKNQMDMSVATSAVSNYLNEPEVGIVLMSSDSDYLALAVSVPVNSMCVCGTWSRMSSTYIDKLNAHGFAVCFLSQKYAIAEARRLELTAREYFLKTFNQLLPNLKECYENISMSSQKPNFDDLEFHIDSNGQLSAAYK